MGALVPYVKDGATLRPTVSGLSGGGLFATMRKKIEAGRIEAAADAEVRILTAQFRVMQARSSIVTAELATRLEVAKLAQEVEREALEASFWQRVRSAEPEARPAIVRQSSAFEELLAEREHIKQHRMQGSWFHRPDAPPTALLPAPEGPDLQPHVSTDAVEKLALKALARFGGLTGTEADAAWTHWKTQLYQRFPDLTAREIENRATVLRQLAEEADE